MAIGLQPPTTQLVQLTSAGGSPSFPPPLPCVSGAAILMANGVTEPVMRTDGSTLVISGDAAGNATRPSGATTIDQCQGPDGTIRYFLGVVVA